jgi:hypothetical protein
MQIGCGVYVHHVRGRPYLYFWHYETKGRSRVQVNEYVGPAKAPRSLAEAVRRCDAYYGRAATELERLRVSAHSAIRSLV